MTNIFRKSIVSIMFLANIAVACSALAETPPEDTFDIGTIKCWDLTGIDEDQRVPALLMVFGYVAGVRNLPTHSGADVTATLERVGKLCTANPDMYVASALERVLLK